MMNKKIQNQLKELDEWFENLEKEVMKNDSV